MPRHSPEGNPPAALPESSVSSADGVPIHSPTVVLREVAESRLVGWILRLRAE
jgi:hypothetical protein